MEQLYKNISSTDSPTYAQSEVTWLMENGPAGGLTEGIAKTGPYFTWEYNHSGVYTWSNMSCT